MKTLGILAIMTLLLMTAVYAGTCTVNTPTASEVIMGETYLVNISGVQTSMHNTNFTSNCTVAATSAKSGDTYTFYAINATAAGVGGRQEYNVTINTAEMIDADDWALAITCVNESNGVTIDTCSRSITVDNTVPICSQSHTSNTEYPPTQTWSVTGTNATSVVIQFGGNPTLTMTEVSDAFTYVGTKVTVPEGNYDLVSIISSDGTNTTACTALQYIKIDSEATAKTVATALVGTGAKKEAQVSNTTLIIGAAVILFLWLRKKK